MINKFTLPFGAFFSLKLIAAFSLITLPMQALSNQSGVLPDFGSMSKSDLVSYLLTDEPLKGANDIEEAVQKQNELKKERGTAQIVGTVLGAVNPLKGGPWVAGADGLSTIISNEIEFKTTQALIYEAAASFNLAQTKKEITKEIAKDLIKKLDSGSKPTLIELVALHSLRAEVNIYDTTASALAEPLKSDKSDAAQQFLINVYPGLSTLNLVYDLVGEPIAEACKAQNAALQELINNEINSSSIGANKKLQLKIDLNKHTSQYNTQYDAVYGNPYADGLIEFIPGDPYWWVPDYSDGSESPDGKKDQDQNEGIVAPKIAKKGLWTGFHTLFSENGSGASDESISQPVTMVYDENGVRKGIYIHQSSSNAVEGMAVYYSFENNANDNTGNYHGTENNDIDYSTGVQGKAAVFNGVDDYISTSTVTETWNNWTVSFYVKNDETTGNGYRAIVEREVTGPAYDLEVGLRTDNNIRIETDNATDIDTVGIINPNEWRHVVVTYDGSTEKVFIDGQLDTSIAQTNAYVNVATSLLIGRHTNGASPSYFKGAIDELQILDEAVVENSNATYNMASKSDIAEYDYTAWGTWDRASADSTDQTAHWIVGQLTSGGNIPTSSSATYNGSVEGLVNDGSSTSQVSGNANLTADFGARTLMGTFNNMKLENNSAWKDFNVNANWSSGKNSISGTLNQISGGAAGTVKGHFFGPQANEVGGYWDSQSGAEKGAGIFRAKQN